MGRYPHAVNRLVLDVDQPWIQAEERLAALPPSLVLVNPATGNFHAWYEIDPIPDNQAHSERWSRAYAHGF